MAINENPSLPNRHTGYIAMSGAGKSQALKQNPEIPRRGVRLLAWDPNRDHKHHCTLYDDWNQFLSAVRAGMQSGQGFRLAYAGEQHDWKFFDRYFCKLVFACLDGSRPLFVLLEELAAVQPSAGAAPPNCKILLNQARKYNGRIHYTTQLPTEISQTALQACENFYIGRPGKFCSDARADKLARIAGCFDGRAGLHALKDLQFYKVSGQKSQLVQLKYKNL